MYLCMHATATTIVMLATSSKMDFMTVGVVRTDPLFHPDRLSDHMHTFWRQRFDASGDDLWCAAGGQP